MLLLDDFTEYTYHIGNVSGKNYTTRGGSILGGRSLKKEQAISIFQYSEPDGRRSQTVQQTIEILQVLLVFDGAVNMQRQVPAGGGEVPLLQFIDRVVFLVVNRDRHPWAICGYRRDSTVAVLGSTRSSMCQGLPMEAFGRISFSACCSRSSLGNLDIVSSSSQPPAPVYCDSQRKLLDEIRTFSK